MIFQISISKHIIKFHIQKGMEKSNQYTIRRQEFPESTANEMFKGNLKMGDEPYQKDGVILDLIQQIRSEIKDLTEDQKFRKAEKYFNKALRYKEPRIETKRTENNQLFQIIYSIQQSDLWEWLLRILCFVYMYLVIMEFYQNGLIANSVSHCILAIFWVDLIMELYHRSFDVIRKSTRLSNLIYAKIIILSLLIVEEILMALSIDIDGRQIRPFRILRAMTPLLYVGQIRRSFQALLSTYKDMFMYMVFYSLMIVSFAILGSSIIKIPEGTVFDENTENYNSLSKMVFIMYICSTHDSYPDNQLLAVQQSQYYYGFFIAFIFLNMFLYSSIPGSLLFNTFIETRSKIILIDEIKMQHNMILAFVSLGETQFQIEIKRLIKFLHYLYKYRVRYVDYITDICLKLNDDGNCTIHVLEFMQLGRILQENSSLMPPLISDSSCWVSFRNGINSYLHLNHFVNTECFRVIVGLITLLAATNSFLCFYRDLQVFNLINLVFTYIFILEILLKIIGFGPENFINDNWNNIDALLIVISFGFSLKNFNHNYSALFKIFRVYRYIALVRNLLQNRFFFFEMEIYKKTRNLFGTIIMIMPLLGRFLPLFLIVYYCLGIIGLEVFYDSSVNDPASSVYGAYDEFSNFNSFIYTQFFFMQVLTQAGWSSVSLDYATRQNSYYLTMIFFCLCHMIVVLVLASFMKSIFWSIFFTVTAQFEERSKIQREEKQMSTKIQTQIQQYQQIASTLQKTSQIYLDTVMKRYIFQVKANQDILNLLTKQLVCKKTLKKLKSFNKKLHRNFAYNKILLKDEDHQEESQNFLFSILQKFKKNEKIKQFSEIEEVEVEDIEQHIKHLTLKYKNKLTTMSYEIKNSTVLNKHLETKLIAPFSAKDQSTDLDVDIEEFTDSKSLEFHIFSLHLLLKIKTCRRDQKALIIQSLIQRNIIDECDGKNMLTKKVTANSFNIDENCTIRRMYLSDTNKNIVDKFEAQYFADIYDSAFKEINKVTIQPLIKLESTIIYAVKNIMRYPQINTTEFFKILSQIQGEISNKLLKKGSLCKFIFKIHSQNNIWFTLHYNSLNEIKINFLKQGVWLDHENIIEHEIYYANDIFKFDKNLCGCTLEEKVQEMKKLYQTFETIALSLSDNESFFSSNPTYHVYDAFLNFIDVNQNERLVSKEYQIEKIMIVLLTKEDEREQDQQIPYKISDIVTPKPIDQIDFKFDQTQKQTFKRLSNLCSLDDDEITANQGLPFAYVMNFLCQMNDILKLYSPNFVYQVEKVLNEELQKKEISQKAMQRDSLNSVVEIGFEE